MKVYEIGTGYTSIPASISAATEIVVEQLTGMMLEQGIDVKIIDIQDDNRAKSTLPITEVRIPRVLKGTDTGLGIRHKLKRVIYSVALAKKLKDTLKRENEKIVLHFHNQYNLFFFMKLVPKRLRRKAYIAYTNHSGIWGKSWEDIRNIIQKRYFQETKSMKSADITFVLNQPMYRNIHRHVGIPKQKLYCIDNGVNLSVYYPLSRPEHELAKKEYGVSGKTVISQVGSVYENKNQLFSIKKLTALLKENKDICFLYAGGIVSEEYKTLIDEYVKNNQLEEQVRYCGMIHPGEQLNTFYNISDVAIISSDYEASSVGNLAVLESLAAGVPVLRRKKAYISSPLPGCIDFQDEDSLTELVKEKIMNKETREIYAKEARKCAEEKFGWDKITKKYITAFQKLQNENEYKQKTGKKILDKKLNGTVIVTYRCNARCNMCNRYKAPSKPEEELSIETIRKLPPMYFTNITGGEPFIRTDLKEIVRELYKKSDRIVISTNGFFTDRVVDLCKEFPNIGIRISIEGLEETNNKIRGLENGFQRGYGTLKKLRQMGMKDVGFGMTVQDANCKDLVPLYEISDKMGMEFATASLHNSFYFVEAKNIIHDRPMVAKQFEKLINELLKSNSPKKWFRAYFNHGLINYIYGQKRLLPCDMSFDTFFIDPYGDVMPCNGTKDKEVMGNLNRQTWEELWNSSEAEKVRKKVRCCDRDCWMIGSVSPAMHKYIWKPAFWVVRHKFLRYFKKKKYSMYENKIVRDYKMGIVTKEELDKCSTCDMCAVINDGLSAESKEQLRNRTGEEIVDADIARQKDTEGQR